MYESNNSSRINIRLTPEEKTRIEQLAKMNNLTVKKLIVDSTLNRKRSTRYRIEYF